jgi:uncharacterized membrane protein YeaQ/YmgE (transglycosylase-associated protein family)
MNLIVWLVVGGVLGWLASIFMRTDARQGLLGNHGTPGHRQSLPARPGP